jgi:hypothetical protein
MAEVVKAVLLQVPIVSMQLKAVVDQLFVLVVSITSQQVEVAGAAQIRPQYPKILEVQVEEILDYLVGQTHKPRLLVVQGHKLLEVQEQQQQIQALLVRNTWVAPL